MPSQPPRRPALTPRPPQLAQPPGKSADAARPWSKYSAGSSRHTAALAAEAADGAPAAAPATARAAKKAAAASTRRGREKEAEEEADPQLAEFLALMQPRRAQKLWVRPLALLSTALPLTLSFVSRRTMRAPSKSFSKRRMFSTSAPRQE